MATELPVSAAAGGDDAAGAPPLGNKAEGSLGDERRLIANGCVPLSHQVAGHMYGKTKIACVSWEVLNVIVWQICKSWAILKTSSTNGLWKSKSILQHPDGTVLKQLQPPPRGPRELDFYSKVYAVDCGDNHLLELQKYLPKYFGIWASPNAPNDLYLKLEDVTHKFNKPCIMDVKIGRKSYDPYASAEKIQQQISKYPLMEEIGFLVLGMRVYQANSDSYETQNQHYGRRLTKETIRDGISRFFHNGCCLRKDAVAASIQKIQKILEWFESQDKLHFYASSLLFVYEGSSQQIGRLSDGILMKKRVVPKGQLPDGEVLEYNNNIHVTGPTENGKLEASVGKNLSKMYGLHKKACSKRNHSQVSQKVETPEQGKLWNSSTTRDLQEHLNGNILPHLENESCNTSPELMENSEVEVRMIDFAHVFPSNTKDEGYIYGLKHLIIVLQSILDY